MEHGDRTFDDLLTEAESSIDRSATVTMWPIIGVDICTHLILIFITASTATTKGTYLHSRLLRALHIRGICLVCLLV